MRGSTFVCVNGKPLNKRVMQKKNLIMWKMLCERERERREREMRGRGRKREREKNKIES